MLKRHYLGYMILGLGLILLIIVLLSPQTESVNSQSKSYSEQWAKPLAVSVLCGENCSSDYAAKFQSSADFSPELSFKDEFDNQDCLQCHGDGIAIDIDFLVSPQEMTNQLQARFLMISKRVFALQPAQDNSQYQAMIESYMQIHHQTILGHATYNMTEIGNALRLLITVEELVNEVEGQNRWAEISAIPFFATQDATPNKIEKKCSMGGICTHFLYRIKPPASTPEKHVSDTPIIPIEIKWSISRRGPPVFSILISITTGRLHPSINKWAVFFCFGFIWSYPLHGLLHHQNLVKEGFIE